jgi:hypothetical protein
VCSEAGCLRVYQPPARPLCMGTRGTPGSRTGGGGGRRSGPEFLASAGVPLGNSISRCELGFCCGISLDLVLREYVKHYNCHRPHQSRQQRPPDIEAQPVRDAADLRSIRRKPVVTGLINEYHQAA